MFYASLATLVVCVASFASAQTVTAQTVTETAIVGHGDPVPRFSAFHESKLIVPEGETVTLPAEFDYDAIEVAGTLKVSRDHDTRGRFQHLTVLPTGRFDCGTVADPIHRNVELIVKDTPIDTAVDPFQFGNGIINYGHWFMHGKPVTSWARIPGREAGATTIPVPADWQVGDELLIPDTRQMYVPSSLQSQQKFRLAPRRESPVKIASITNGVATLSKPLDFEHLPCKRPDGSLVSLPVVGNMTRNIVVRSENPLGTRGHTINLAEGLPDCRYVAFLGLGRTLPIPINNAVKNADGSVTPGTNQIARYAYHWHHVHSHHGDTGSVGAAVGCYFNGSNVGKWGVVQHGTHGTLIKDNIGDQFVGSAFIAEDGNETLGIYEGNLACYCKGEPGGRNGKFAFNAGIPGGEGAGFWLHGSHHTIRGNVACCNAVGYQIFHMNQVERAIEGAPANWKAKTAVPVEFSDNEAFSNASVGFESWRQPPDWSSTRLKSWHNGLAQALVGGGERGQQIHYDATFIAAPIETKGYVTAGLHSGHPYTLSVKMIAGEVRGCAVGISGEANQSMHYENLTAQNAVNFDLRYDETYPIPVLKNIKYLPLGNAPLVKLLSNLTPMPSDGSVEKPDNSARLAELRELEAAAVAELDRIRKLIDELLQP